MSFQRNAAVQRGAHTLPENLMLLKKQGKHKKRQKILQTLKQRSVEKRREKLDKTRKACPVEGGSEHFRHQIRMFVLIWVTVCFFLRGSADAKGSSVWGTTKCQTNNYCVTLHDGTITAEAGLCAVISCSFTAAFTPTHIIWYKCDPLKTKCEDSVFDSNMDNDKVQSGFKGRISLLEPDVSKKNCSIIISDLKESDSGLYQLRVEETNVPTEAFTYTVSRASLSVTGLTQKPTVVIPPLTEGQESTLTCTAPGLCSGSQPKITWTWRKGGKDSQLTGNITAAKTENLTAVTQRHSSTLTFNLSAEHHGTNITCQVSFEGNTTREETVTLNVNYRRNPQIIGSTTVKEGDLLNLTCRAESFPPSVVTWTNHSVLGIQLYNNTGSATLEISNVTAEASGQYTCTATHLNTTTLAQADVTVIYKRKLQVIGNTTVKKGSDLNLTCSVESSPPSVIKWTKHSAHGIHLHNNTGSAALIISNVTAEDSGQYICTATHQNKNETTQVDVTVTWLSKIQNGSGCFLQSKVLTCVCISEGFPLPTIKWPLLEGHAEYSVIRTVSNNTVSSTVSLNGGNHGNMSVECVSSNGNAEAKQTFMIKQDMSKNDDGPKISSVSWLQVILAFFIGVLLSALFSCLILKYCRKKQKNSGYLDDNVEMISQDNSLVYMLVHLIIIFCFILIAPNI
ncbi:sialic acid-binding Ig-like lectin 10 [Kryptolebias marmoratus]|uniref:sialic acid-binding Ig-like lectin 10 n=1 Tax=Kryptolebias marmoratus TaxID=37003 RepID=UPI0018AD0BF3|nr:sialic acid-binding Ig-like lectin 10 [Kryptolebias marmoratus]